MTIPITPFDIPPTPDGLASLFEVLRTAETQTAWLIEGVLPETEAVVMYGPSFAGKTYVALGVFGMLRHLHPTARVMVIAPRENIQRKWVKELKNFVRRRATLDLGDIKFE